MEAYVGVDWDRKKAIAAAAKKDGRIRRFPKPIKPTTASVKAAIVRIRTWFPEADTIRVAIEAGNPRWVRLFHQAGAIVHLIDAKQAAKFAESLSSSGAKSDARDAQNLLLMAQSPAHRKAPWCPPEASSAALLRLVQAHQLYTQELTRTRNRIRAFLAEHLPALDEAIKNLNARWLHRLLRFAPSPRKLQALSRSEYEELMEGSGMHRATRKRVWEAIEETEVLLSEGESVALELTVEFLLESLRQGQSRVSRLESAMESEMEKSPKAVILRSVSGVGLKLGAGLLSVCFSGAPQCRDEASIRLGSSPVSRHSGQMKRARVRMRRASGSLPQHLSYLLGLQAMQRLSWAKAMYDSGRARNQTAGTVYRRISRSLLRILTAMLRDGQEYDEARYIRALQDKGVPWAADLKIPSAA